jgi:hypothetical protein
MAAQVHQLAAAEAAPEPGTQQPSLDQLLQHSRNLFAEGVDQVRDISDLAFMELELAVASSKWWLLAVLMFCVSSLLFFTFTIAALVVLLVETATPAAVLLLCGIVNAIGACVLFFWIKSLSQKLTFRNLRQHLSKENA